MRAVHAVRFGGPKVLTAVEIDEPVAQPGHVVIGVSVAEILFLDTQLRSGWGSDYFPIEPPYVPGAGVAGTVMSAGDGVDPALIGQRVVAGLGFSGGYAEQVQAVADKVVSVPDEVELTTAVAALHDGTTALSRIEKAKIEPGHRVLVTAAGGSLGGWLIPLSRAAGAQVIATARGEQKLESARDLGADVAIDYTGADWAQQVLEATKGHGVDVVFDGAGGRTGGAAFEITADGGRFFSYGAASGDFAPIDEGQAAAKGISVIGIDDQFAPGERELLIRRGLAEIASGTVTPIIGQTFPLDGAADAHAAIEARSVVGKTLLKM
ncbi:zinc-binding dehydrogenase [Phytoactinopolyspora mesophila]|uniref:Zinc-binding dehydrogenase n=1 Tax=Phytoactinopolyspora mesophila TaxID=2650750 RepID=A0A7K3M533_9ACTN|nr:zinc-binding dehydrogenase [Phytoactinopolyspora mesophila]NDL58356.1 zinc-binding dehydrogenase [Phytoactinopolyspora mesophila]